jgi:hypothetical protein
MRRKNARGDEVSDSKEEEGKEKRGKSRFPLAPLTLRNGGEQSAVANKNPAKKYIFYIYTKMMMTQVQTAKSIGRQ